MMLDDIGSLNPLSAWLVGEIGWQEVVFGNPSGVFGRSLPMAAFLANAALGGDSVYTLKLGNLAIHLLLGGLVFLAARAVLAHTALAPQRSLWAFAVAAVWLLHPLQLSTVLYVVQRMTQLSAFFSLLAVIAWFAARAELAAGDRTAARLLLFAGVPLATLLAILSKENGALAPLLCIALDLALFGWRAARPVEIRIFIGLTVAGGVAGALWALWSGLVPGLLAAYEIRDFTLAERLLTQPRVLADYVGQWFWPDLARLGLYHDGFPPSRGWLDPPSTLLAMLGWGIVLTASLALRRQAPLLAAGLWFYLAGHLIESSAIGLELYFEHRNYLPTLGLALATIGLVEVIASRSLRPIPSKIPITIMVLLLPLLALATHAKAIVWSSGERIVREAALAHPQSIRAWAELAGEAMRRNDPVAAHAALDQLALSHRPEAARIAALFRIVAECSLEGTSPSERMAELEATASSRLTLFEEQAIGAVVDRITRSKCRFAENDRLIQFILRQVEASSLSERHFLKWRLRFHAARLHEAAGHHTETLAVATPSWDAGVRASVLAALLAYAHERLGQHTQARQILDASLATLRKSHPDRPTLESMQSRVKELDHALIPTR